MSFFHSTIGFSLALQLVGVAVLLLASVCDICSRRIPNQFVLIVLGVGLVNLSLTPSPFLHLGGFLVVFAGTVVCWQMRWLGGGDTKLLTAAALLVPPTMIPLQLLAVMLVGGMLAVVAVFGRMGLVEPIRPAGHRAWTPLRVARIELWRIQHGEGLPYAVAIALGTVGALIVSRGGVS